MTAGGFARLDAVELRAVPYDHPDAVALVEALLACYRSRYDGEGDRTPVSSGEFAPPEGCFLVGYLDGVPVLCGGWRRRAAGEDPALRDGDIEIKRMYVVDAVRGRGLGRGLLAELERRAELVGGRRMVLETGTRQPEAIGLYTSGGYRDMPRFGTYRDHPLSRCFAKPLPSR